MAAKSLSSRDIRFSEAVKFPWERGEGRARRCVLLDVAEEDTVEVAVVGDD